MHHNIAHYISNNNYNLWIILIGLMLSANTFAQEEEENLGNEVVNVVKPYTPTISDAFKVKETPSINDASSATKKDVQYAIFSVPVASTFTPSKGKAATVKKIKQPTNYDNYATLGFGNFTTILGELYSNFEISRTDNAGFYFKHNSSQGGINDLIFDNNYFDTSLDGYYNSRSKNMSYGIDAGIEHQIYNWYGVQNDFIFPAVENAGYATDISQSYFTGNIGGTIALNDSYFEKATANIRFTSDAFSSSEFNIRLQPQFAFPIADVNVNLQGDLDFLSGSFDKDFSGTTGLEYSFLNAGIVPSITYLNRDLTVDIGAAAYLSLDSQASESNFFIYPRIKASYKLVDELLIAYAGADGGLDQNSYYNYKEENPFISPTLFIAPTNRQLEAYGGAKGKLTNNIGYNLRASYQQAENQPLFVRNPTVDFFTTNEGYQNGNSFNVVYDAINTIHIFGELQIDISDNFALGTQANFYSYSTDIQQEAWNLPTIEASIFSNFNITKKLYGGTSLFFVGQRKDVITLAIPTVNSAPEIVTLDSFLDINLHAGYKINDRLSVFLKGSNLLSNNYDRWHQYPVQGLQVLGGATYKFDW